MTIERRKNREREEKCALIINAAEEIIASGGLEKLSIRKIAVKIDYSPAIIYHYFRDKEDILEQIMQKNYQLIVSAISSG